MLGIFATHARRMCMRVCVMVCTSRGTRAMHVLAAGCYECVEGKATAATNEICYICDRDVRLYDGSFDPSMADS